jgi:hypothetical protein
MSFASNPDPERPIPAPRHNNRQNVSPASAQPSLEKDLHNWRGSSPASLSPSTLDLTKSAYPTGNCAFRNATSNRTRRSIVPHKCGLSRNDSVLSSFARSFGIRCSARCLTPISSQRYRNPRLTQQSLHNASPQNNRKTCARRSQDGHRNRLQLPRFGNLRRLKSTSTSTSPKLIEVRVISAVIAPVARNCEALMVGRSSIKTCVTASWVVQSPPFPQAATSRGERNPPPPDAVPEPTSPAPPGPRRSPNEKANKNKGKEKILRV